MAEAGVAAPFYHFHIGIFEFSYSFQFLFQTSKSFSNIQTL